MLAPAAAFSDWIVAVHIVAVVVAFGALFAYPVIFLVLDKQDRRAAPAVHRVQLAISRRIINPGLLVVVLAGVYLASDLHDWKKFFVQWGLGVAIVLGGLEGGFMISRTKRLLLLAERDVAAAGAGEVAWGEEYLGLVRQVGGVGAIMGLLVVATIFVMVVGAAG
jgi:uncharacterized membrane protein